MAGRFREEVRGDATRACVRHPGDDACFPVRPGPDYASHHPGERRLNSDTNLLQEPRVWHWRRLPLADSTLNYETTLPTKKAPHKCSAKGGRKVDKKALPCTSIRWPRPSVRSC